MVRDVGSGGGTHSSPKLLLTEWCRKNGCRNPIYKFKSGESGEIKVRKKAKGSLMDRTKRSGDSTAFERRKQRY